MGIRDFTLLGIRVLTRIELLIVLSLAVAGGLLLHYGSVEELPNIDYSKCPLCKTPVDEDAVDEDGPYCINCGWRF